MQSKCLAKHGKFPLLLCLDRSIRRFRYNGPRALLCHSPTPSIWSVDWRRGPGAIRRSRSADRCTLGLSRKVARRQGDITRARQSFGCVASLKLWGFGTCLRTAWLARPHRARRPNACCCCLLGRCSGWARYSNLLQTTHWSAQLGRTFTCSLTRAGRLVLPPAAKASEKRALLPILLCRLLGL